LLYTLLACDTGPLTRPLTAAKTISHNLHRTFRQRIQKRLPVLLRQDPVIQHHHDAGVCLRAD